MSARPSKPKKTSPKLPKYVRRTGTGKYQVFMSSAVGGKQRTQGTFATVAQAEARAAEVELRRKLSWAAATAKSTDLARQLPDMTVAQAYDAWHGNRERDYVDHRQWIADGKAARAHLLAAFGHMKVADLRRLHIEKWAAAKTEIDGYAVSTVRNWIIWMKQVTKWYVERCREENVYCAPPLDLAKIKLRPPATPKRKPRAKRQPAITALQFAEILTHLRPDHRVVCTLQYALSLRVSEAHGLSVYSIDWERQSAHIVQQLRNGELVPRTKTPASERELPLPPLVAEMLREYIVTWHGPEAIRPYDPTLNGRELLIVGKAGSNDVQISYFLAMQEAFRAVLGERTEWRPGIGDVKVLVTPHHLRKSFNTLMSSRAVSAGRGVRHVSLLDTMGHTHGADAASYGSSETNAEVYELRDWGEMTIIAECMEEMLRPQFPDGIPLVVTDELILIADVAKALGVSRSTAVRRIERLGLPTFRLPTDRRWIAIRTRDFEQHFTRGAGPLADG